LTILRARLAPDDLAEGPGASPFQATALFVGGDPYERGLAQGDAFRADVRRFEHALLELAEGQRWIPRAVLERALRGALYGLGAFYLPRHRPLLERCADGQHLRALEGLAAGLGVSTRWLYGLHAFEIESTLFDVSLGCTALGFAAEHTEEGEPKLSYNHDFPHTFQPFLFVRRVEPPSPPSAAASGGALYGSVALTYGPLVGAIAGINQPGLAITVNQAYPADVSRFRRGWLVTLLVQECLDRCAGVEEAIELLTRRPATNGSIVTLVDARGGRAVVEVSGRLARVRRAEPGRVLASFNKYRHPDLVAQEVPLGAVTRGLFPGLDVHECNLTRQRRFDALEGAFRRLSTEQIRRVMADHDDRVGDANTICRHDQSVAGATILSAQLSPRRRSIEVIFGYPCQGSYRRFSC
jgi:hypothetical protein